MTAVRATVSVWTVGVGVLAVLPAPSARFFDGLPWTSLPELALLATVLAVVGSPAAQDRLGRFFFSGPAPAILRIGVLALPAVAAVLLATVPPGPSAGFSACYGTLVPRVEAPPCERSFDAPFAPSHVTRFDRTIDFEDDWRLGFVNSRRFNFHRAGQMDRQRLPFRAAWSGTVETREGDGLEIEYVGEGFVQVNRMAASLPPRYLRTVASLTPPAGRHAFVASYQFDDGSRVGKRAPGEGPRFRIHVRRADGTREPLRVAAASTGAWVPGAVREILLALSVLVLGASLAGSRRILLAAAIAVVWVMFTAGVPVGPWPVFLVLCATALGAVLWPGGARPGVLIPVAVAVAAVCARQRVASFADMYVRSGGQDWLTYEGFARTILETWSLEGGEAVFYYQPLYRYVKFLLRLLFGEGDALVLTALNTGLFAGVLILTAALGRRLAPPARLVAVASAVGMFALFCSNWAQSVVYRGLSEPVAWALFPLAMAGLFCGESPGRQFAGMVAAGACAVTRLNHLPATGAIAATFFARYGWRRAWLPAAVLGLVLLVPLAHNLAYGGAFVLTTTSAAIPNNVAISPSRIVDLPWTADTRAALGRQVALMFDLDGGWWETDLLSIGLRLSEALWIVAIGVAVWRRTAYHVLVALLPASYLAAHLVYELHVYYPRHIIAAHLAMAVSACLVLLPPSRPAARG